jgi:uncharacterized protein YneR
MNDGWEKQVNEFTVKENDAFRMRVEYWECVAPKGLYAVNFINECINKDGVVDHTSTYNFYLTKNDMSRIAEEFGK